MICVSVMGREISEIERKAERVLRLGGDLVELRLDFLKSLKLEELRRLVSKFAERAIVTLRPSWEGGGYRGSEEERIRIVEEIASEKPAYVDLELMTRDLEKVSRRLRKHTRLIVSFHDFSETPSEEALATRAQRCLSYGNLGKIVTMSSSFSDNLKILGLYGRKDLPSGKLIAFAMGEKGVVSRILSPLLGSPIAYACLPGEEVAPGQLTLHELREILRLVTER